MTDDAFLRTCFDGSCSSLNYGQTGFGSLADAAEPSVLLLRIPVPALSADRVEVTLHLLAELGAPASAFTLTAFAIDSPCVWNEGPHDGDSLNPGEPGVTHQACNGDPDAGISWGDSGKANVFDHIDSGWSIGQQTFVGGEIADGELFSATIVLDRLVDGPTPDALVITSSATALNELFVFTSEDELEPPVVEVVSHCR